MAGLNKAMLIGNLGRDPEIRYKGIIVKPNFMITYFPYVIFAFILFTLRIDFKSLVEINIQAEKIIPLTSGFESVKYFRYINL